MSPAGPEGGSWLVEMTGVMARLRAECPWKAAQTPASLRRYLLEEAHETLEALDAVAAADTAGTSDEAAWAHLREELGDLLLQIYFHAAIAAEQPADAGRFDVEDVARGLVEKMWRRNPHVFGAAGDRAGEPATGLTADEVDAEWQRIKAAEKADRREPTDGVPGSLPALLWAEKVAGRLGLRSAEPAEAQDPHTAVGERLLAVVLDAREQGVDAELALRDAVRRRLA
ncbi:MazG nucleotide pyrophosphohydrolase domain-containing protein [Nocardioides bruguierae]|uniref:Nucleoside triphosphate pyrophosphohydrolase n=1 Tax=Nocardioides bruguierae TaxID=2945102 RepID=A0A9X2D723_9ACTN|nr:MazG nucleotide pyrophosphohydrolase domain-containing protein [Nocardioides bruguierae]MCM0619982.1 nucleoside triphosphate pyrophosphohydrolase [Nocardioides bruguierae]